MDRITQYWLIILLGALVLSVFSLQSTIHDELFETRSTLLRSSAQLKGEIRQITEALCEINGKTRPVIVAGRDLRTFDYLGCGVIEGRPLYPPR